MDPSQLYLFATCGLLGACIVSSILRWTTPIVQRAFRRSFAHLKHAPLSRSNYFPEITRVQLFYILLYLAGNICALSIRLRGLRELEIRFAIIASVNLLVTFIGGRTNALVDLLNISLPSYYLFHHTVGRVAILEASTHGILILLRQRNTDLIAITGYVCIFSLTSLIILSLRCMRRRQASWFGKIHALLYLSAMGALAGHVVLQSSVLGMSIIFASWAIWLLSHFYRLCRTITRGVIAKRPWDGQEATLLTTTTYSPVKVFPGCYFYVYTSGRLPCYDLLHGQRFMLHSHNAAISIDSTELTFLVSRQQQKTWDVGCRVLLDGPYGASADLQKFETVILVAKGIGIVSVLPSAIDLANRRFHDDRVRDEHSRLRDSTEFVYRDATTRVDLIWWVEHNGQLAWVSDQLKALQKSDFSAFVSVWCIYPSEPPLDPPYEPSEYWRSLDGLDTATFSRELRQETRYPGQSVVLTCGDNEFVSRIRTAVLDATCAERDITFCEAEYRPQKMRAGLKARVTSGDSDFTLA